VKSDAGDERARRCLATMELDRMALRELVSGDAASAAVGATVGFPRSRTFRWVASHVSVQALATTAASMLFASFPLGRLFRRR
jgi:hypothetical protein